MYTNTAIQEHSDPTPAQDLVVSGNTEHRLRGKERGKEEQQKRSQSEADSGFSGQYETPPCSLMQRSSHPLANSIQNDDGSNRIVGEPPQSMDTDAAVPSIFKVGSVSNEVDETDNGASTEHTPVQEESVSDSDSAEEDVGVKPVQEFNEKTAQIYLSPSIVAMLKERKKEIKRLNKKLNDAVNRKIALEQERKMLKDRLKEVEEKAKENEDTAKKIIQEKINELEEYKTKLSQIETEKEEMESQYQGRIKKLEEDLVELERDKKDKEKDAEVEKAKLVSQLSQAKMELLEKDLLISEQNNKISELEHKNTLQEKEAEYRRALEVKEIEQKSTLEAKEAEHRRALEAKDAEIMKLNQSIRDLNLSEDSSVL